MELVNMNPIHERYRQALKVIQEKIDEQSNDGNLWVVPFGRKRTMHEEALVYALHDLHDVVERFTIPIFEKLSLAPDLQEQGYGE